MVRSDIINTYTSNYTWKLENVQMLRKLNNFQEEYAISIQPVQVEFTRFKWHCRIYDNCDNDDSEAPKETEIEFYIYQDELNGFYDQFSYNCEIEVISERGKSLIPQTQKDKTLVGLQALSFIIPRAYKFMELHFIVFVKEHDLSGCKIRSMDSFDYKRNLIRDLKILQRDVINTDLIIDVENCEVLVHKTILAMRSPVFDSMINKAFKKGEKTKIYIKGVKFWTFSKFLKFIYSGCVFVNCSNEEINVINNLLQKYSPNLLKQME
ncbi:hypothetical protein PVAND_011237 [Polypedilum vanderplanki]|uniref:BTB domain-containing protein n=1 Tax=Polypedilum vanderplanki TaxID=319348 RepID=A0A9J6CIN9_POLVA|nr:hypothetical protein PVAND_011237 [Polypedilum vanderplanki]